MKWFGDTTLSNYIHSNLKVYPDWPKAGVNYLNTVDLCRDPDLFWNTVMWYSKVADSTQVRTLFAAEARGFLWASPIAFKYQMPLHVVRKKGKLPGETVSREYDLEYGTDTLEIAKINKPIGKVMIVDDVLATGGTAEAICKMLHEGLGIDYNDMLLTVLLNITCLKGEERLKQLGVATINLIEINE